MTPLTESVIREMRLACRKTVYQVGGTEYRTEMAHKRRDPRTWWYTNESWMLNIGCEHNSHGEYYLSLGEPCGDSGWFCFLRDGKYGGKFLHLRHVRTFEELALIIFALTELRLCLNEQEAKEYLDTNPTPCS